MYMDRVEDLDDALQALQEIQSDSDSMSVISRFLEKRLDGVVYQVESAVEQIKELQDKLGDALERVEELENEHPNRT